MRHLRGLALIEVALLPGRMVGPTGFGPLVAAPRRTHLFDPGHRGAVLAAVAITVVAVGAQEEHPAAPATGHEP
jgi:hypothetical protein